MNRFSRALLGALLLAAAGSVPALASRATLDAGGLAPRLRAAGANDAARSLAERAQALRLRIADGPPPALPGPPATPKAIGDRLLVSLDDDVPPIGPQWEGRLDVSEGPAGASDAVAVRFPAQSLATAPPFDVRSVVVGLDDRHGAWDWPVELWLEDAASPLQPRRGASSIAGTATPAWTASTGARPTAFERVAVPLRLRVPDAWLTDGAFDDDFDRSNGPLADGSPDWVECEDGDCQRLPLDVDVVSRRVVRTTGGGSLIVVKMPAPQQEAQRPHDDIDLRASVRIVDTAPTFGRAGLVLRALAADAHYRVEYRKAPSQVEVTAVLPAPIGAVPVGAPLPVSTPSAGSRLLEVTVSGGTPAVSFAISVDGVPLGTITDATWRLTGALCGLSASDPASSGEAWDDFRVERRPDVFVVLDVPAGEDAGLPLDRSDSSRISRAVLRSADGIDFQPLAAAPGCPNPGNPFVQLEVEDAVAGDRLFQREAHVVGVTVSCPTCPLGTASCPLNLAVTERSPPTLTVGEPATVRVRWWNEHLVDDTLIFRTSLWSGPCEGPNALVTWGATAGIASARQAPAAVAEADAFTFTPSDPGPQCLVVEELHDSNGDCCPDGAETTPLGGCGGTCSPVPPSDSNPSSVATLVDLSVERTCDLRKGEDVGRDGPDDLDGDRIPDEINLDGTSLRAARGVGGEVLLAWSVHDALISPAIYNVHVARAATFERAACYPVQAPVTHVVVRQTTTSLLVPTRLGESAWLAVFETDGCAGRASVPDASRDDPALGCP